MRKGSAQKALPFVLQKRATSSPHKFPPRGSPGRGARSPSRDGPRNRALLLAGAREQRASLQEPREYADAAAVPAPGRPRPPEPVLRGKLPAQEPSARLPLPEKPA